MLYHNLEFGFFYLSIFFLYWYATQRHLRWQNLLILASSYFFYGWWDWRFLGLIIFSSLVDYLAGRQIAAATAPRTRKGWLLLSLVVNLGLLGVFKYYGFFVDSFIDLFRALGYEMSDRTLQIILPVGISFYTFQTLSYSIDIYRGRLQPARDIVAFLAFVSFFPQLIAGPIERASNLLPQFYKARRFDLEEAKDGLRQVLWGLFKKVVVADNLGAQVDLIVNHHESWWGSVLVLGVVFFAFQLYGDFSGYSDIAIGTARILGFRLMRNFNYPYFARDIMDFWRRWHISLTTWFRDYVFLSLSGGKAETSKWRLIRNYILTFTISGLWHGASWNFVAWGFLHGLYHIPYVLFPNLRSRIQDTRPPFTLRGTFKATWQIGLTAFLNLFALVFFMTQDLKHAMSYYAGMLSTSLLWTFGRFSTSLVWLVVFVAVEWGQMYRKKVYPLQIGDWPVVLRWGVYYGLLLVFLYFNYDRRAFIYFQF
ncbi:MAG: MBOAT family protein [Bacteroidetes bacterium]|nr:MAG: MBOAT family protein [Bacteroidota bacterium]